MAFLSLGSGAGAAVRTWTGSTNGYWTNALNWDIVTRPTNGDSLFFPAGPARLLTTNLTTGASNFTALTFTGPNYFLFGPPLFLTNGLTNTSGLNSTNTMRASLTARTNQTWAVASQTTLLMSSNVNFTNVALTAAVDGLLDWSGAVAATVGGTLNKTGQGKLRLGSTASIAQVNVQGGSVQVDGTLTGGLAIGAGGTLEGSGTVPLFSCNGTVAPGSGGPGVLTISSSNSVFNAGAVFSVRLNGLLPGTGHAQLKTPGPLNLSGASLQVLPLFDPVLGQSFVIITNTGATAFSTTFNGLPEGATQTVNSVRYRVSYSGGNGNDVTLTVVGFTASSVARNWDGGGANVLWMNATNWSNNVVPGGGQTLIFPEGAAQLSSQNNFPLGTPFNGLTFGAGGYNLSGNPLILFGGVRASQSSGGVSFSSPVNFSGAQTVRVDSATATLSLKTNSTLDGTLMVEGAGRFIVESNLTGTGGLDVRGNLTLQASNNYGGVTRVLDGGTITVSTPRALGVASLMDDTFVESNGLLTLALAQSQTMTEPLRLAGAVAFSTNQTWSGPITLLGTNAILQVAAGSTVVISGVISGTDARVSQLQSGTILLPASNSVTGTWVQQAGTLLVNGSSRGLNVEMQSGTLSGTGEVANVIGLAGTLHPGADGTGTLTCSNFIVASPAMTFVADVSALANNVLRVRGALHLAGTLQVNAFSAPPLDGVVTLIDKVSAGPVTGSFGGLGEGDFVVIDGMYFEISYTGGDGNDVTLRLLGLDATGVTRVWDGGGANNLWSNPANWQGDVVPRGGDAILFPSTQGAADFQITNDLAAGLIFDRIIFRNGAGGSGTQIYGHSVNLLHGLLGTNTDFVPVIIDLPMVFLGAASLEQSGSPLTFKNAIALGADLSFVGFGNINAAFQGPISGGGGLNKMAPGNVNLLSSNSFLGAVRVLAGSLNVAHGSALGAPGGGTFLGANAILGLSAFGTLTESSLVLTGFVSCGGSNMIAGQVTLGAGFTDIYITPLGSLIFAGPVKGPGGLVLRGGGRAEFPATNTYSGPTLIESATVVVQGSSRASDFSLFSATSLLGGAGAVGPVSAFAGALIPGTIPGPTPGVLAAGSISFSGSAQFQVELNGLAPGSGYDQLSVTGSVSLGGTPLRLAVGFAPEAGDVFTIINNAGPEAVDGTFADLPEGSLILTNGLKIRISYLGGDGNDVTLTRVVPPTGLSRVWDGGGANNLWSNPLNWSGDVAPEPGDDVVFPAGVAQLLPIYDAGVNTVFNRLTFGANYELTPLAGHSLRLLAGVFASHPFGTAKFSVPVTLDTNQVWQVTQPGGSLQVRRLNLGLFTLTNDSFGTLSLADTITGAGGLELIGPGATVLVGTNTFLGPVHLLAGRAILQNPLGLGASGSGTYVDAAATLALNLPSGALVAEPLNLAGSLESVSGVTNFWSGPVAFSGLPSVSGTVAAARLEWAWPEAGGELLIFGLGTLVFSDGNSAPGRVWVMDSSRVLVNGQLTEVSFEIMDAGHLGGVGTVGPLATASCNGCSIEPGLDNAPGSLVTSNLDLSGAVFRVELAGPTPGASHDQLDVRGAVNLSGASLAVSVTFLPALGQSLTIINNDGFDSIVGTFNGMPEGALIALNGVTFQISYVGGEGNDVTLTHVSAERIWNGGGADTLWTTAANWVGGLAPGADDELIFPAGAARLTSTNNFPTNTTFQRLRLLGSGFVLSGNRITLRAGLEANYAGSSALNLPVQLGAFAVVSNLAGALSFNNAVDCVSGTNQFAVWGFTIVNSDATVSDFRKTGPGQLQFLGFNANEQRLQLDEGLTLMDGTWYAEAFLNGGELGGTGYVARITGTGGMVAPGHGIGGGSGILSAFETTWNSSTVFSVDLNGSTPGIGHDQVSAIFAPDLAGATLTVSLGFQPAVGQSFVILDSLIDPVTGTFAGLSEGARLTVSNLTFRISYVGGDGNDVTLTRVTLTRLWTGAGANGFWSTAANWSGGLAPGPDDDLFFPDDAARLAATNDFSTNMTFHWVRLFGPDYTLAGNQLNVSGGVDASFAGHSALNLPVRLGASAVVSNAAGTLSFNGPMNAASGLLVFDGDGTTVIGAGTIEGGVRKIGAGQLHLVGFQGSVSQLQLERGVTLANGEWQTEAVLNGGTLGGTGYVAVVSSTGGGVIAPGAGLGVLSTFLVYWNPLVTYSVQLNGLAPGSEHDQLFSILSPELGGATLAVSLGFTPAVGDSFVIMESVDDYVIGTFAGLPEGALLTNGLVMLQISYVGGDGNDVTLTRVSTAPPSTLQTLTFNGSGQPVLTGQGMPNMPYVLEATSDLNPPVYWQSVCTDFSDSFGRYQLTDPDAGYSPTRFYRVLSP